MANKGYNPTILNSRIVIYMIIKKCQDQMGSLAELMGDLI